VQPEGMHPGRKTNNQYSTTYCRKYR